MLVTLTVLGKPICTVLSVVKSCAVLGETSISLAVPVIVKVILGSTKAGLFKINASSALFVSFQFACALTSAPDAIPASLVLSALVIILLDPTVIFASLVLSLLVII